MKSLTAVCQTAGGATSMPAMNPNGRIARHPPHRGDGENAEMKMYLSKLKDLVPFMPKNRKLSKLEIIQHVIDYICDLQTELETHPEINNFDAAAALSGVAAAAAAGSVDDEDSEMDELDEMEMNMDGDVLAMRLAAEQQEQLAKISSPAAAATRLPLIDRQSPNTILPAAAAASAAATSAAQTTTTAATAAPVQQSSESLTTQNSGEKDSRQS
ncbi:protein extra-macrochaetae [Drosophila albomicans]|uniref:Protein extra-macrochaetae n=1 Tax=Drosophila albomicans TaxID=7291 RepID=A0A6P8WSQ8_DROAB|nr:protein extra-macrochaetae [Drosophila albomicans]